MKQLITSLVCLAGWVGTSLAQQAPAPQAIPAAKPFSWTKQTTEPFRGKQDDLFALDEKRAWYGNGEGKLYRTRDGGTTWTLVHHKPGTFWRCLGFVDSLHGFAGNVGTDYFPGVTDTIPLYETRDGGSTWSPVKNVKGGLPKGLCAIFIQRKPFVNHGKLDYKSTIYAAGRVGSPAWLMVSTDEGQSWTSRSLSGQTEMIFDIVFTSDKVGYICGASSAEVDKAHPQVLRTDDGGKTWKEVWRGSSPYEMTWKASFPTEKTGFISIQSYNPDTTRKARYIIKTSDAGKTWQELPVAQNFAMRQFGIGFVNEQRGWLGTTVGGYETLDGGLSWNRVTLGRVVNKIRLVAKPNKKWTGYAIGMDVYRLEEE